TASRIGLSVMEVNANSPLTRPDMVNFGPAATHTTCGRCLRLQRDGRGRAGDVRLTVLSGTFGGRLSQRALMPHTAGAPPPCSAGWPRVSRGAKVEVAEMEVRSPEYAFWRVGAVGLGELVFSHPPPG